MRSPRILLVQMSFLGDAILSTPLIGALKDQHPEAEIWTLTTPLAAELLRLDPRLAGTLTYDKRGADRGVRGFLRLVRTLRSYGFTIAYSAHRSLRTALLLRCAGIPRRVGFADGLGRWLYSDVVPRRSDVHAALRFLSLVSGNTSDTRLRLFAPDRPAHAALQGADLGSPVVIFPGSVWATKRWSTSHYHELARRFVEQGDRVCILGSASERAIAREVAESLPVQNLCGELSLADTLWLVQRARLVVCNDSMALHVASAFERPTVAVFCSTSPRFGFGPWRNRRARVVEKSGLACKPCHRHGAQSCPTGTRACMDQLLPDSVWHAVGEVLA